MSCGVHCNIQEGRFCFESVTFEIVDVSVRTGRPVERMLGCDSEFRAGIQARKIQWGVIGSEKRIETISHNALGDNLILGIKFWICT